MELSERLTNIARSATLEISQKARDLQNMGVEVLSLSAGEPDFDTPEYIKQAAKKAIDEGKTKYTNVDGIDELKSAICEKFKRDNSLEFSNEQINISPGGKAVIYNALVARLNPGDEVIIPTPCWVSYPEMVKLAGGKPVLVQTLPKDGFLLTPDSLQNSITGKTRCLIINSPSNPTGAIYGAEELSALAEILQKHEQIMVLSDEIYEHLAYEKPFVSIANIAPQLKSRILTMNGVSKAYAMTGWRIGYAGGAKPLIKAMAKIMGQTTSNPCTISQWAAIAALAGDPDDLQARKNIFQNRRDFVLQKLSEIDGLETFKPEGAFYAFVNCKKLLGKYTKQGKKLNTDIDFANALLQEEYVAIVPGSAFHAPGYFRVSFTNNEDKLAKACERIKNFCYSLRKINTG